MQGEELNKIAEEIKICQKCELCKVRTNAVPGAGNLNSKVLLVGEAPGKNEDLKGLPFVGAAGKLLDDLLESIKLKREDVFITNIVKCRPPNNRDPLEYEKDICSLYLKRQVEVINPKIIITLGRHSMNYFFPNLRITTEHGKQIIIKDQIFLPLYHPAAALYNGGLRATLFQDFKTISSILSEDSLNKLREI